MTPLMVSILVNCAFFSLIISLLALLMVLQRLWLERKLRREYRSTFERSKRNVRALLVLSMLPLSNLVIILQLCMPDTWINKVDTWFGK